MNGVIRIRVGIRRHHDIAIGCRGVISADLLRDRDVVAFFDSARRQALGAFEIEPSGAFKRGLARLLIVPDYGRDACADLFPILWAGPP